MQSPGLSAQSWLGAKPYFDRCSAVHRSHLLQENCLVVCDRQAAAQVVSYFKANRVGTANCKIIAELTKYDRCVIHSLKCSTHQHLFYLALCDWPPGGEGKRAGGGGSVKGTWGCSKLLKT